jgi:hypothetical protein
VVNVTYPPAGGSTYVTVEPAPEPVEVTEAAGVVLPDERIPLEVAPMPDEPTPLVASTEDSRGWSLFDLIATILALLLLVAFFIRFFFDRPKEKGFEGEPCNRALWESMTPEQRAQYQAKRDAEYQVWQAEQHRKAARPKTLLVNIPVLLIAAAALIEALIVLFSTQDFAGPMTIVDDYSVAFAVVVFVQLLAPLVAAALHNNRQEGLRLSSSPRLPFSEDNA